MQARSSDEGQAVMRTALLEVVAAAAVAAETRRAVVRAAALIERTPHPPRGGWPWPGRDEGRRALAELHRAERSAGRLGGDLGAAGHLLARAAEPSEISAVLDEEASPGTGATPPDPFGALPAILRAAALAEEAWAAAHRVAALVGSLGPLMAAERLGRRMELNAALDGARAGIRSADALAAETAAAARILAAAVGSAWELPRLLADARAAILARPARSPVPRPEVPEEEAVPALPTVGRQVGRLSPTLSR